MIKVEPCRGCGRILMIHPVANLTVRLESEPLDAQGAATALVAGRNLWRVTATSAKGVRPAELSALRTAEPGERPYVVQEHRCTAAGAPHTPSPVLGDPSLPKGPEAGVQSLSPVGLSIPSSEPSPEDSSAPAADRLPTEVCSVCRKPLDPSDAGNYVALQLGATVVDSFHANCP